MRFWVAFNKQVEMALSKVVVVFKLAGLAFYHIWVIPVPRSSRCNERVLVLGKMIQNS